MSDWLVENILDYIIVTEIAAMASHQKVDLVRLRVGAQFVEIGF